MKIFTIGGRCLAAPPPAGWREQLAQMLGSKPRRIGTWAELGLFGALRCMADAGETTLPPDAQIWLGSRRGTYAATAHVLEQVRDDLPMPLAFLQTQPSQLLAMLAAQLAWQGHACFMAGASPQALLRLAGAQGGHGGVLLGWVDEMDGGESNWLRLLPCDTAVHADISAVPATAMFSSQATHLCLTHGAKDAG
ncbi:hypothetical protein MIZ01_0264 [Sideroxyarcus emersonii]|uniref:Beta-ketoacyl synthase N-terminal domain-containing protein n=1 Tax=Sideroxyarcus emersonii TaxID=2764705 RepID=A0AAN1X7Q1_9PROT|nr:hypothetical protein [Sideroxyarcus emersonii]BCK86502.1 hypothetical protein MIZ01_0264 [Sideroxyarcus emersonii]